MPSRQERHDHSESDNSDPNTRLAVTAREGRGRRRRRSRHRTPEVLSRAEEDLVARRSGTRTQPVDTTSTNPYHRSHTPHGRNQNALSRLPANVRTQYGYGSAIPGADYHYNESGERLSRTGAGRGIESHSARLRRSATPGLGQTNRSAHHPAAEIARPQSSTSNRYATAPSARFRSINDQYEAVRLPPGFRSNNPYHRQCFREYYGFGYTEWMRWLNGLPHHTDR